MTNNFYRRKIREKLKKKNQFQKSPIGGEMALFPLTCGKTFIRFISKNDTFLTKYHDSLYFLSVLWFSY